MNPFSLYDIIIDEFGTKYKVLAIVGNLVWTSLGGDFKKAWPEPMSWEEMDNYKVEGKRKDVNQVSLF